MHGEPALGLQCVQNLSETAKLLLRQEPLQPTRPVLGHDAAGIAGGRNQTGDMRWRCSANPVHRDLIMFGLYTGMRRGEISSLRWERVDLKAGLFRVEETKTRVPLELPITRRLGVILVRRRANSDAMPADMRGWVFPSMSSKSGHVEELHGHYAGIGKVSGTKFWFHGLRNVFITVAERELMLPRSL